MGEVENTPGRQEMWGDRPLESGVCTPDSGSWLRMILVSFFGCRCGDGLGNSGHVSLEKGVVFGRVVGLADTYIWWMSCGFPWFLTYSY